jgi:mannose-6-phosphate isomerase-like protein (cupin superfamily)
MAGDGSLLQELLHPDKADVKIRYSLAHAIVAAGQATKPHRLKTCEVYYILEGRGLMHTNEESLAVGPGTAIYIPPGVTQYIENTGGGELKSLCIVDPAWRKEDELVLSS